MGSSLGGGRSARRCAAISLVPLIKGQWQLRRAAEGLSEEGLPWGNAYGSVGDPEAALWKDVGSSDVQNGEMGSGIQPGWGLVVSGGVREGNPHS